MGETQRLAIDILLREYDTLRMEILARVRTRFELLGFLAIIATIAATQDASRSFRVLVGVAGIAIALTVWGWFASGIKRCAKRIFTIEAKVNELMGAELLAWETSQPRGSWWRRLIR
jgi:hypothetical protein